jgi:hypothetical protein
VLQVFDIQYSRDSACELRERIYKENAQSEVHERAYAEKDILANPAPLYNATEIINVDYNQVETRFIFGDR